MTAVPLIAAVAVALVLAIACTEHLLAPGSLAEALRRQGVLPRPLIAPVAMGVVTAEGTLALALGYALVAGDIGVRGWAALAGAGLFTAYALYSIRLLPASAPCGCSRADMPVSIWIVARAGAMAALSVAAFLPGEIAGLYQLLLVALAGTAFAVLLWVLPVALVHPEAP